MFTLAQEDPFPSTIVSFLENACIHISQICATHSLHA